jgi:structural maintenance of chromosome 2
MRPQEILGMVEEAAGTRMFEERKDKAKKTMSKKDKRVQEITTLLDEEITPKLDRLREEKRAYLQYQKSLTELERIGRLLRAWEWTEGNSKVERKQAEIDEAQEKRGAVNEQKETLSEEIAAAEEGMKEVEKQREKELKKGGKFKKLEEEASELDKLVEKLRTQVEIKETTIKEEEKRVAEASGESQDVSIPCSDISPTN